MNFTTRIFKRFDGQWGSIDPNTGEWVGMIKNILDEESDFICSSVTLKYERSFAVTFLNPLGTERRVIAIKGQELEGIAWEPYYIPFHWEIWIMIGLFAVINTYLITMAVHYNSTEKTQPVNSTTY
jgi:ionotropic glutamate receptor